MESLDIGMIANSGIGKTTLVNSILNNALEFTNKQTSYDIPKNINKKMEFIAGDDFTRDKLNKLNDFLKSPILEHFTVQGFNATSQASIYKLLIKMKNNKSQFAINILDFPGEWICSENKDPQYIEWLNKSKILFIPIDSTFVMEAFTSKQLEVSKSKLGINITYQLVHDWVMNKVENKDSGLIIFIPMKTESYFNDNVLHLEKDKSNILYQRIKKLYHQIIELVMYNGFHQIKMVYHPIDTYGIAKLMDFKWNISESNKNIRNINPKQDFILIPKESNSGQPLINLITQKGVEDLFVRIIQFCLSYINKNSSFYDKFINFFKNETWIDIENYIKNYKYDHKRNKLITIF